MTSILTIEQWLQKHCALVNIQPLAGDASFRRYFRVQHTHGSYIAMDASAEKNSCVPFVAISRALRQLGLCTPDIIAQDLEAGFLLLTDFGDRLLLNELNLQNARQHYSRVLTALTTLQTCSTTIDGWTLKQFTAESMRNELNWFREWFLEKHLALSLSANTRAMLDQAFDFLAQSAASQPQVFVHRDFHSANLMCLPQDQIGILDFQDAFIGPVTYDLVSLLRDCYISWPEKLVTDLMQEFFALLPAPKISLAQFTEYFDLMGVQRHLKALMTFSRKYRRDQNANYLQHVPRTLQYVLTISEKYAPMKELNNFLTDQVREKCVE